MKTNMRKHDKSTEAPYKPARNARYCAGNIALRVNVNTNTSGAYNTSARRSPGPRFPAIQQSRVFPALAGSAPPAHGGTRGSLSLVHPFPDPRVDVALEETQVFVQNAEANDGGKRKDELGARADVPGGKDDAGVDDLSVPQHVHGAPGKHVVSAVVHSECWCWFAGNVVCVCGGYVDNEGTCPPTQPPPQVRLQALQRVQLTLQHARLHEIPLSIMHARHQHVAALQIHEIHRHRHRHRARRRRGHAQQRGTFFNDGHTTIRPPTTSQPEPCSPPSRTRSASPTRPSPSWVPPSTGPRAVRLTDRARTQHFSDVGSGVEVVPIDKREAHRPGEGRPERRFARPGYAQIGS